ncbi:TipJ family phage tail tip protein, partial [Orrella sp. 11846]|uniref:TipJ family phage tail tip protein n=1 Tax=Orrella sp. 11846 TaxID=3409913 RepID=UPI003B5BC57B
MTVEIKEIKGGLSVRGSGGGGKGGGGSARTPVEYPDSARSISYAVLLDVVSNGEIEGFVHPNEPLRDVYLDGTPIQNTDGSLNFESVQMEYRAGTVDQTHIPGFPASAHTISVGVEVKQSQPWTQTVTNSDLSALRVTLRWPALLRVVEEGSSAGDRTGTRVDYAIDLATNGGVFVEQFSTHVEAKARNYERTHRIDLPPGTTWTIRVRRLTADSTNAMLENAFHVQSYAEVIDGKFRYPMTALVGLKVDARQFSRIPTRAYRLRGMRVRVPSNYDPVARTYSGVWDGSFKTAWSNNPAWIYYDLLTNRLYGLGDRISAEIPNRYALYQIGAYCDQLVPDGLGGTEPRFVCNVFIQKEADALRVIGDLASVFRGISYWAGGMVEPVADMPSDAVYTYTNSNVIDGIFEYAGADSTTRKTVALVSWNDPSDFYRAKVEVVEDKAGIQRFGIRKEKITSFGATSRGQAARAGNFLLYTSRMEGGGVTFSVGLDGVIPQPGDIIRIADKNRAGRTIGGRLKAASATVLTLDRDVSAGATHIVVNLTTGAAETREILNADGATVTVKSAFSSTPAAQAVWSVRYSDLSEQYARVISIAENDGIRFTISAVDHHPGKHAAIDNGVRLDPLPVSVVPPRVQRAPTNIQVTQHHTFHQGTTRQYAEITWDAPEYAATYDVQWRRDNGEWVQMPRTGARLVQIEDIYAGTYIVRVRAINALDVPSLWAYSALTELTGIAGTPPSVTHLSATGEVMAIRLGWGYPAGPSIIERVEIKASLDNDFGNSYVLAQIPFPANSHTLYGLGYSTETWFWVRLIDKNGLPGPWYPSESGAGVFGKPTQDAGQILDYLEGKITSGELAQELVAPIESIPDIKSSLETLEDTRIPSIESTLGDLGIDVGVLDTRLDLLDSLTLEELSLIDGAGLLSVVRDLSSELATIDVKSDEIAEAVLRAAIETDKNKRRLTDAGIQVDPDTGEVYIYGLRQADERIDSAEIRLQAAEANINLKASTSYVQQAILEAVLDPSQIAELGDIFMRLGQAEVDISGLDSAITLKADQLEVQGQEVRLSTAEGKVDALEGQIAFKADITELDAVESRVSSTEITLNSLDIPSITQSVTDVRALKKEQDDLANATLQDILTGERNRQTLDAGIALAETELRAHVDDGLNAEALARQSLAVQVNDNRAASVAESRVLANAIEAEAQQRQNLAVQVGDNLSAIESEALTRANEDEALAGRIDTMQIEVGQNTSAIQTESQIRANENETLAGHVMQVQSVSKKATDKLAEAQLQDILTGERNRQGLDDVIAVARQEVLTHVDEGLNAEALARQTLATQVQQNRSQISDTRRVLSDLDSTQAQVNVSLLSRMGNAEGLVASLEATKITAAQAESIAQSEVSARIDGPEGLDAKVQNLEATKVDATGATSVAQSVVNSRFGT